MNKLFIGRQSKGGMGMTLTGDKPNLRTGQINELYRGTARQGPLNLQSSLSEMVFSTQRSLPTFMQQNSNLIRLGYVSLSIRLQSLCLSDWFPGSNVVTVLSRFLGFPPFPSFLPDYQ